MIFVNYFIVSVCHPTRKRTSIISSVRAISTYSGPDRYNRWLLRLFFPFLIQLLSTNSKLRKKKGNSRPPPLVCLYAVASHLQKYRQWIRKFAGLPQWSNVTPAQIQRAHNHVVELVRRGALPLAGFPHDSQVDASTFREDATLEPDSPNFAELRPTSRLPAARVNRLAAAPNAADARRAPGNGRPRTPPSGAEQSYGLGGPADGAAAYAQRAGLVYAAAPLLPPSFAPLLGLQHGLTGAGPLAWHHGGGAALRSLLEAHRAEDGSIWYCAPPGAIPTTSTGAAPLVSGVSVGFTLGDLCDAAERDGGLSEHPTVAPRVRPETQRETSGAERSDDRATAGVASAPSRGNVPLYVPVPLMVPCTLTHMTDVYAESVFVRQVPETQDAAPSRWTLLKSTDTTGKRKRDAKS